MAHVHAELMVQYAQDAAETDSPWERWEVKINNGEWCELNGNPNWVEDWGYRRKPQVIRVGRHEFPKPITEVPEDGTEYFCLDFGNNGFVVNSSRWTGDVCDTMSITAKRTHLSREAAQAHADTLNAICRGDME